MVHIFSSRAVEIKLVSVDGASTDGNSRKKQKTQESGYMVEHVAV